MIGPLDVLANTIPSAAPNPISAPRDAFATAQIAIGTSGAHCAGQNRMAERSVRSDVSVPDVDLGGSAHHREVVVTRVFLEQHRDREWYHREASTLNMRRTSSGS